MKFECDTFFLVEGKSARLDTPPTTVEPLYRSGKHYRKLIQRPWMRLAKTAPSSM